MNDRVIRENSANDFSIRMDIRRTELYNEIDTLKGQIELLYSQEAITTSTNVLLRTQLNQIKAHCLKIESDYYDMRNKLAEYENQEGIKC